jgi:hypothetical protein
MPCWWHAAKRYQRCNQSYVLPTNNGYGYMNSSVRHLKDLVEAISCVQYVWPVCTDHWLHRVLRREISCYLWTYVYFVFHVNWKTKQYFPAWLIWKVGRNLQLATTVFKLCDPSWCQFLSPIATHGYVSYLYLIIKGKVFPWFGPSHFGSSAGLRPSHFPSIDLRYIVLVQGGNTNTNLCRFQVAG